MRRGKRKPPSTLSQKRGISVVEQEHHWLPTIDRFTGGYIYICLEGDRRKVDGEKGMVELDASERNRQWARRISHYLESLDDYCYVSK